MTRRRAPLFVVALLAFTVSGVCQSKHIREQVDPYNGQRTLFLFDIDTRACPGDPPIGSHDPQVRLIVNAWERPGQPAEYTLTTELNHGSPLNLRRGDTMDTLMDEGVGYFIASDNSAVTTAYDGGGRTFLREVILFHVTRQNLVVLSTARTFQFRINGSRQSVQRCTDDRHLRDLAEFLDAASIY